MNIVVINGSMRKESTYHFAQMVIDSLKEDLAFVITEFFLPKDLPSFCAGCYNCIFKSETKCPHATSTLKIQSALREADLVVLTSPVYVFDVSGQMKSLLDHFGFQWMSHRPDPSMFRKAGLGVVTGAGAGMKPTLKTLTRNLFWWGTGTVFGVSQAVMAASFQDIPEKIKEKMMSKAAKTAKSIAKYLKNRKPIKPGFLTRFLFDIMKAGKSAHPEWNEADYDFWKRNGYLDGIKPWHRHG